MDRSAPGKVPLIFPLAATPRIETQKSRRPSTSSATVGSSSTSSSGSPTIPMAKRTRWVWPPERLLVRRSAISSIPASSRALSTSSGLG